MARMMILKAISIALTSLLLVICSCDGLKLGLLHRHSPKSPLFNASSTGYRRLAESLDASLHRGRYLSAVISPQQQQLPEPDIQGFKGEYLMEYSVGTPPVISLGVLDTASDLTWTQCIHCRVCILQDLTVFNPSASSTYKQIECGAPECLYDDSNYCSRFGNHCRYSIRCRDKTLISGALATDTFTFHPDVSVPGILFGCGSINSIPVIAGESGVVGFGKGKSSFIRQLEPIAKGRFSYCFVPIYQTNSTRSSKLHLGDAAVVSGPGAVTTPLVDKSLGKFYFVSLEGISVGNETLKPPRDPENPESIEGNMVLDTAATQLMLPLAVYEEFERAVRKVMKLEEVEDPERMLRLCYRNEDKKEVKEMVDITLHFSRGADVKLKWDNIFAWMSKGVMCLIVTPNSMAVLGSLPQVNFLVGYDLVNNTVTFMPTDCSKL